MGLDFLIGDNVPTQNVSKSIPPSELLWEGGCKVCPRNKARMRSPKMKPSGSDKPLVLILGEAPGSEEDWEGQQFVGASGRYLRPMLPDWLRPQIMWDNATRCWPGEGNPTPGRVELECCRPLLTENIEAAKPQVIFGMGNVPLTWAGRSGGITLWRGRRFPLKVGSHVCWYYPMFHPAHILRGRTERHYNDDESAFQHDLRRAIAEIKRGLPLPVVYTEDYFRRVTTCLKGGSGDLDYLLKFFDDAAKCSVVGVDYETQNTRPYHPDSRILTIAVSMPEETVAFAFQHPQAKWQPRELEHLAKAWVKFLRTKSKKAVHSLAFEMEWTCCFFGDDLARSVPWEDTMTQAFVLDERVAEKVPFGLGFLMSQHFGIDVKKLTDKLDMDNMRNEPLDKILPYNAIDAKSCRLLYQSQAQRIRDESLAEVYREKLAQVPSVVLTQIKGIEIDVAANEVLSREYARRVKQAEEDVADMPEAKQYEQMTGEKFNPGSSQHVVVLLRDILKTRAGQDGKKWSGKEDVLQQIDNPICQKILTYRKVTKLKSTYIDTVSPKSKSSVLYPGNVIHTNLGTCFTETGRLECLTGDSLVYVLDARGKVPIKDIRAGDWVWSYDSELKPVAKQVRWAGQTKRVDKLVEVAYRTQGAREIKTLRVTPDHPFRLRSGVYKQAAALRYGDRLLSVERTQTPEGYRRMYFTGHSIGVKEHMVVMGCFEGTGERGWAHIHHKDNVGVNNVPTNLERLSSLNHRRQHPWSDELRKRVSDSLKRAYAEGRKKVTPLVGELSPTYRRIDKDECIRILHEGFGRPTIFRDRYGWDYATIMKKLREHGVDWRKVRALYNDRGERLSELVAEARRCDSLSQAKRFLGVSFYRARELLADDHNHMVVAVRKIRATKPIAVYDIEVPGTHNFIANGVCVHNSTEPNIQNWPVRSDIGKRVRRQVKAGVFASFDYGQIDARIIACGSRDKHYCTALWEDNDIHKEWALKMAHHHPAWVGGKKFIKDPDVIDKFRSGKVKNNFVFALFYGASLRSTARRFGVDDDVMAPLYREFWKQFADVKQWQESLEKQYNRYGYVQLFDGLRRRAPLGHGQRINSPVQSSTNRIVMSGMNRLSALGNMTLQANFQIHDDLSFCFKDEREFEESVPVILDIMLDGSEFPWFCVPLSVELKSGPNWADTTKVGTYRSDVRLGWPKRHRDFGGER